MLYSYRHPDQLAKDLEKQRLLEQDPAVLVERRSMVRDIPAPAAIESTEEDAWSLWDQATSTELTAE